MLPSCSCTQVLFSYQLCLFQWLCPPSSQKWSRTFLDQTTPWVIPVCTLRVGMCTDQNLTCSPEWQFLWGFQEFLAKLCVLHSVQPGDGEKQKFGIILVVHIILFENVNCRFFFFFGFLFFGFFVFIFVFVLIFYLRKCQTNVVPGNARNFATSRTHRKTQWQGPITLNVDAFHLFFVTLFTQVNTVGPQMAF